MNEQLPPYWTSEVFKWEKIEDLIKKQKLAPPLPELSNMYHQEKYSLVKDYEELERDDTGLGSKFEQSDGIMIEVQRETKGDLQIIADATFTDTKGQTILKLSDIVPEGYTVVEGTNAGQDFMNPTFKCIVVSNGFLESIGGRLAFIHEVGHAHDFSNTDLTREELLLQLKGFDLKTREVEAWRHSQELLGKMAEMGVQFFPEWFKKEELEKWIDWCRDHHNYPELEKHE